MCFSLDINILIKLLLCIKKLSEIILFSSVNDKQYVMITIINNDVYCSTVNSDYMISHYV